MAASSAGCVDGWKQIASSRRHNQCGTQDGAGPDVTSHNGCAWGADVEWAVTRFEATASYVSQSGLNICQSYIGEEEWRSRCDCLSDTSINKRETDGRDGLERRRGGLSNKNEDVFIRDSYIQYYSILQQDALGKVHCPTLKVLCIKKYTKNNKIKKLFFENIGILITLKFIFKIIL